jgi:dihydrofolate reductase
VRPAHPAGGPRSPSIDNDLVDELRLMVFPVVLGAGERLFAETAAPKSLRLVDSKPANDCLILTYEAAASKD